MKHLPLLGAVLLACQAMAQAPQLSAPAQRISDAVIQADHQTYEATQARLRAINAAGRPLRDYPLAKAQCWLDVSLHEYTRNDRSAFPQAALGESAQLAEAMERGSPAGTDTPLVNGAARLREDLWARASALKASAGWACAQQRVACAEVELVHAGNEFNQQGWRHAQPYVQISEDQLAEAEQLAAACPRPAAPAPAPVPVPAPAPVPAAAVQELRTLSVSVVFNFDRHAARDIRPWSVVQLEDLLAQARRDGLVITDVELVGHADRLNGTGQGGYNARLSQQRVLTVRDMLARLGLDPALMRTAYRGDEQQVQGCEGRFTVAADLQECLLPNRRVEVRLQARRR